MEKFSQLTWYNKLAVIAGVLTSMGTLLAYMGLSFPTPVWAEEFQRFQKEYYIDKLGMIKEDLRDVKMEEYKLRQASQPVPEFIIEEKMILEDKVEELEKKVDKIEQTEHVIE